MTVAELIAKLEKLPANAELYLYTDGAPFKFDGGIGQLPGYVFLRLEKDTIKNPFAKPSS